MQKINFGKNKKSAQFVVEFALAMPILIIAFTLAMQLIIGTYSKYKFSYIFHNTVSNAVRKGITIQETSLNSNSKRPTASFSGLKNDLSTKLGYFKVPVSDLNTGVVSTSNNYFIVGSFQYKQNGIFKNNGTEYFYTVVPISRTLVDPIVINTPDSNIRNFLYWYYTSFAEKFYEDLAVDPGPGGAIDTRPKPDPDDDGGDEEAEGKPKPKKSPVDEVSETVNTTGGGEGGGSVSLGGYAGAPGIAEYEKNTKKEEGETLIYEKVDLPTYASPNPSNEVFPTMILP